MSEIDKSLCDEALKIVNGNRREKYDVPERNFHRIALAWEAITDRSYTASEIALMFVALKLVRQSHAAQRDNIVDGIGYLLCADAVTTEANPVPAPAPLTPTAQIKTCQDHYCVWYEKSVDVTHTHNYWHDERQGSLQDYNPTQSTATVATTPYLHTPSKPFAPYIEGVKRRAITQCSTVRRDGLQCGRAVFHQGNCQY